MSFFAEVSKFIGTLRSVDRIAQHTKYITKLNVSNKLYQTETF